MQYITQFHFILLTSVFYEVRAQRHGAFFIEIHNFWAWADKFWVILDILGQTSSTHFGAVNSLSMFFIIQPLFLQKTKPLYQHPIYLFGIGI